MCLAASLFSSQWPVRKQRGKDRQFSTSCLLSVSICAPVTITPIEWPRRQRLRNKSPLAKNPLADCDFQGSSGFIQGCKLDQIFKALGEEVPPEADTDSAYLVDPAEGVATWLFNDRRCKLTVDNKPGLLTCCPGDRCGIRPPVWQKTGVSLKGRNVTQTFLCSSALWLAKPSRGLGGTVLITTLWCGCEGSFEGCRSKSWVILDATGNPQTRSVRRAADSGWFAPFINDHSRMLLCKNLLVLSWRVKENLFPKDISLYAGWFRELH